MIDAFVEGVRSIVQACHLVILAPVAMAIIAARGRWQAVVGAVVGVVIGGYIFVTRWFIFTDLQLRVSAVVVILSLAILTVPAVMRGEQPSWYVQLAKAVESSWSAAATTALIGIIVTLWWRPCVGEQFGEILTLAPREPLGQLLPTVGFMVGIAIPLVLIGLAYAAWAPAREVANRLGIIAGALGVVLAASVVVGQHGEIVGKLFQWSQ